VYAPGGTTKGMLRKGSLASGVEAPSFKYAVAAKRASSNTILLIQKKSQQFPYVLLGNTI
jgi:hypothetical protein